MVNQAPPSHVFKPKWYWYVGGAAGAFVVYRALKARQAASSATADVPTESDDLSGAYGDYSGASGGAYGTTPSLYGYTDPATGAFISAGGNTPTTVLAPTTNPQWFQQATALLISEGYDPILITTAFGKWVANTAMSQQELDVCQAAMSLLGTPPTTLPAPHVAPPAGQVTTPIVADGWYKDAVSGVTYQIAGGKRYRYLTTALARMNPAPKTTTVYPTWNGYKLPLSGVYR